MNIVIMILIHKLQIRLFINFSALIPKGYLGQGTYNF